MKYEYEKIYNLVKQFKEDCKKVTKGYIDHIILQRHLDNLALQAFEKIIVIVLGDDDDLEEKTVEELKKEIKELKEMIDENPSI